MRRNGLHCAARVRHQHMGLLMFRKKRITYRNAIFAARPLATGNTVHFRSASRLRSFHWCSKGLRISTQGRPPRLMCGATGVSLSPFTDHCEAVLTALSVEWIARYNQNSSVWDDGCTSWRFSDHASCSGNVPPC